MRLIHGVLACVVLASTLSGAQQKITSIQAMSGWVGEQDIWGGGHDAIFSMTQHVNDPSFDGQSTKFSILGGKPYSNVLFHKGLGQAPLSRSFVYDMYVYYDHPESAQTLEVAVLQQHGKQWYKLSTQCQFSGTKVWRFWSGGASGHWVPSAIACNRFPAQKWSHLVLEMEIVNGKTHFISETIDGVKHYVNLYGAPEPKSTSSDSLGVHFQMDGNAVEAPYSVWVDLMQLSIYNYSIY